MKHSDLKRSHFCNQVISIFKLFHRQQFWNSYSANFCTTPPMARRQTPTLNKLHALFCHISYLLAQWKETAQCRVR